MYINLIVLLFCCREFVKYICICKMLEISIYRKKKRKEKILESIIFYVNDWYMVIILRVIGIFLIF